MIEELRRETLAAQISRQLMTMISDRNLAPGDALPSELALTELFSVSRPVVREALVQLKSLGIVDIKSGRPPVVQAMDGRLPGIFFEYSALLRNTEVFELLEVRRGLEVQCAALAARRANEAEIAEMQEFVAAMKSALDKERYQRFIEFDMQLHLKIASSSRNQTLFHLVDAIREPLRESIAVGIRSRSTSRELKYLHDVHEHIVDAIAAHDEAAAADTMARHFDKALAAIIGGTEAVRAKNNHKGASE